MPLNPVYREDGLTKACVASDVTFYLFSADGSVPDCSEAYRVIVPELRSHVRWYRTDQMRFDHPIDADAAGMLPYWCSSAEERRQEYSMLFGSGETAEEVGPWGFDYWLLEHEPNQFAGYFQVNLPFELGRDEPERLAALVGALADVLPFRSGHAGFGLQLDEGDDSDERDQWARGWCGRNLGVSARDLIGSVGGVTQGIRNVSWITLVDEQLLSRLGSVEDVQKQLGSEVVLEQRRFGVMIRAGHAPVLGDVNRQEDLSLYKRVDAVLRPIRIETHPPFPGFTDEDTNDWLARLDEP